MKICIHCKKDIQGKRQKFCSDKCGIRYHNDFQVARNRVYEVNKKMAQLWQRVEKSNEELADLIYNFIKVSTSMDQIMEKYKEFISLTELT